MTAASPQHARVAKPARRRFLAQRSARSPIAVAGITLSLMTLLLAILGPKLTRADPLNVDLGRQFMSPSMQAWFGTDELGRDLLSRCLSGIGLSLSSALIVTAVAVVLGILVGGTAGFLGGSIDNVLMRITDMFLAFPALVLALAIAAALGPSLRNAVLAVAVVWWPWYARMVRAQVMSVKETAYIEAAEATGVRPARIFFRHILPNCMAPVMVMASTDMGAVVLTTAGLNFIGLGAKPPTPELGAMVSQGRLYLLDYWWVPTFPGLVILFMVLGFNLLGDALRDWLDPQLRGL
ncbi:MAG: ABC transporter permease [Chloroflexi bacterium]|nr:MAG: ABC transporter permease [Chloroflexota bacterium]